MRSFFLLFVFVLAQHLSAQVEPYIYISSRNTHSVKYYQADGTYLGDLVAPNAGNLSKTQDLFFHPHDGTLILTGIDNSSIKRYDPQTGDFMGNFSSGYSLAEPTKMAIGPDSLLYVSQWGDAQNKVARFDLEGNFVDEFTSTGLNNACGMAWDAGGNLYVAFYGNGANGAVQKFDTEGNSLGQFISSANLDGPVGLWQDDAGEWLVVDWTKGSVERFDVQGAYLGTFISGLQNVEGHAFDAEGNIYLCDWAKNIVNRYLPDGTFDAEFINTGGLLAPNSIIFGPAPQDPVGIIGEKAVLEKNVHIYPNPGMDSFIISSPALIGKTLSIQAFSSEGKMIWERNNFQFTGEELIPAKNWQAGTYTCRIWVEENTITKLLIKK